VNTFLGVELGIQVAEHLVVLQEDLSEPLRQLNVDVRWTPADQMRVLLKDFGPLQPGQRERLEDLIRAYARATHSFQFRCENVRFYPSMDVPRMIVAEINDQSGLLEALRTNVEKAAEPLGFPSDTREWKPLVLLGRLMTTGSSPDLRGLLNTWRDRDLGETDCLELVLFSVQRYQQRARTKILRRYELGTGR
jgi:2'-5' RNA ligase